MKITTSLCLVIHNGLESLCFARKRVYNTTIIHTIGFFFLSLNTVDTEYMLSLHYTLFQNLEGEGVAAQQAAAPAWVDVPQGYSGHKRRNWWLDGWLCWM
jgi:hypothetical protein